MYSDPVRVRMRILIKMNIERRIRVRTKLVEIHKPVIFASKGEGRIPKNNKDNVHFIKIQLVLEWIVNVGVCSV